MSVPFLLGTGVARVLGDLFGQLRSRPGHRTTQAGQDHLLMSLAGRLPWTLDEPTRRRPFDGSGQLDEEIMGNLLNQTRLFKK